MLQSIEKELKFNKRVRCEAEWKLKQFDSAMSVKVMWEII